MSDVGKITEIEPEDGLGWIEMPDGTRVRFGGTACKGFVPTVGMTVRVLGTKPGYGGTVKATELNQVKGVGGAPAAAGLAAAVGAQAAGQVAAPASMPRTGLHTVQSSGVKADDMLLRLLGLADVIDPVFADLKALHFELKPSLAAAISCNNPWFYVIASDGDAAYGLYTHPMVAGYDDAPWLQWDKKLDRLRYVAATTVELTQGLLATPSLDRALGARMRETFVKLGMPDEAGAPLSQLKADWLPPEDDELRPLADYLVEPDGVEMERGLLAYASRKQDQEALTALQSLYDAWEWCPLAG